MSNAAGADHIEETRSMYPRWLREDRMVGVTSASGRCACGAVSYRVDGPLRGVFNCHCTWCRRTSGHFAAATQASRDDFTLESGGSLTWWSPNGRDEYGFCSICGGTVLWKSEAYPDKISIFAGSLNKPTGLETTGVGFSEYASDYHILDDSIPPSPAIPA